MLRHYEQQSEDAAVAEDEAAFADPDTAAVPIPRALVPQVVELIEEYQRDHR